MNHLSPDRLLTSPEPRLTPSERSHLSHCGRCRAEARLLAAYLSHSGDVAGLDAAHAAFAETRTRLSRSLMASVAPAWFSEGWGEPVEVAGERWWQVADRAVPDDAAERAVRVSALAAPALVPWQVRDGGVASRWLPGQTLDRWAAEADEDAIVRVMEDVAAALRTLHRAGLACGGLRAGRVLVRRGRAALLFAGLDPGTPAADADALRALASGWLGLDLPGDAEEIALALAHAGVKAAFSRRAAGELSPGATVERYTVEEVLGRGGMAVVYAVRHRLLRTRHALKVLTRRDPSVQRRLLREGRLQARLDHPGVVPVLDVVDADGVPGLVMPLVRGPSLAAVLARTTPDVEEAAALFRGIVDAVAAAHALGIVHRDLKPSNVLLEISARGVAPRVADFGLAKANEAGVTDTVTRTGATLGTAAYAAPEQLRDAASVDAAADLWGLGCVLYEMLTGRPPFRGASAVDLVDRVTSGTYPRPEGVPPAWVHIVEQLLQPEVARRWTLDQLQQALEARPEGRGPVGAGTAIAAAAQALTGPVDATAFVDRDAERATLSQLIAARRPLVTIAGGPGVGKTALAREVVRTVADGVWVDAGSDPQTAVAEALGTAEAIDGLRAAGAIHVVLDGLDGAGADGVHLLEQWLQAAPEVRFLVTSREPVRLRAEHVVTLGPLAVEATDGGPSDAARLLSSRVGDVDLEALARSLDGLPLALVAAGSVDADARERALRDPAEPLSWPSRDGTVADALQRSWDRLDATGRDALARLARIDRSFGWDGADEVLDAVAGPPTEDVLASLVERGLLVQEAASDEPRWRLLGLVRAWVRAKARYGK